MKRAKARFEIRSTRKRLTARRGTTIFQAGHTAPDFGDVSSVKGSFDVKRFLSIFFIIFICVIFGACGDVSNVDIHNETSKIFSQDDITAAEKVVLNEFKINWSGCTLKKLYYPGDDWSGDFEHWRQFYNADQAIVLLSDYDVDVDSPTAKAGTTYSDLDWVLVRNNGEDWEFKTCGY